jgi:hypothetical protein
MRARPSIRNSPTIDAWYEVPQATKMIRLIAGTSSLTSSRLTSSRSRSTRPTRVSATARGCSWISFSMKCLKPPFSACIADQVMILGSRFFSRPSKSVIVTASLVRVISSPSSTKMILRVSDRIAVTSEAMKFSPSPRPMTIGEAFLAATSVDGSLSLMTTKA